MDLLFVIPSLKKIAGSEKVVINLANHFVKNYNVKIALFEKYKKNNFYKIDNRINIIDSNLYKYTNKNHLLSLYEKIKRIIFLRNIFKNSQPVIVVSFLDTINIYSIIANFFLNNKIIISERCDLTYFGKNNIKFFFKFLFYRFSDCCIFQTKKSKDLYKNFNFFKSSEKKWKIIPNYFEIDKNSYSPKNFNKKNKIVIAVGRITYQKGFDILIRVFENVTKTYPNWKLYIYGEGEDKNNLLKLINNKKLKKNIFIKKITNNIHKEMIKSSIFVIPSRFEGFPNVLGEALTVGLPAIGFKNVSGVQDLILHNKNGYLADYNNATKEIEHYIKELIKDKKKRLNFGKVSMKHIKKWDAKIILNEWQDVFKKNNIKKRMN